VTCQVSIYKILDFWAEIIFTFSQCQLTQEEDKLVAMSGIAKVVQKNLLNDQYLAGLWRQALDINLLWYIENPKYPNGELSRRPKQYRAPSWSWTSVDGQVIMPSHAGYTSGPPEIEILEAVTEPLSLDPTGQVKRAFIRLLGPLMTFTMRWTGDRGAYKSGYKAKANGECNDNPILCMDVDEPYQNLYCMPIKWCLIFENSDDKHFLDCLLLQPTALKKGQFTRLGWIRLDWKKHKIHQWNDILRTKNGLNSKNPMRTASTQLGSFKLNSWIDLPRNLRYHLNSQRMAPQPLSLGPTRLTPTVWGRKV
jgi:hypothetical protein